MVVCQTNRDTDCEQQCHVIDKCAAGFYKEEADKICDTGNLTTLHGSRTQCVSDTHEDSAYRQYCDRQHQGFP